LVDHSEDARVIYFTAVVPYAQGSIYFGKSLISLDYPKNLLVSIMLLNGPIELLHFIQFRPVLYRAGQLTLPKIKDLLPNA
jgi:hypothetical protein